MQFVVYGKLAPRWTTVLYLVAALLSLNNRNVFALFFTLRSPIVSTFVVFFKVSFLFSYATLIGSLYTKWESGKNTLSYTLSLTKGNTQIESTRRVLRAYFINSDAGP